MTLFRYIPVWRRSQRGLILYRCFESLEQGGGFGVQSADHFFKDVSQEQHDQLYRQFVELLAEQNPLERFGVYPTLESAVEAFDREFGTDFSA
jgi:hypothetical protein